MDSNSDDQPKAVIGKQVYSTPILQRLGTLKELTRSIGQRGFADGQATGTTKRTSL